MIPKDLIKRTKDLLKQATEEKSHYYVASILKEWLAFSGELVEKPSEPVKEIEELGFFEPEHEALYKKVDELVRAFNQLKGRER